MVTQQKKRVTDTVLSSIAAMFVAMSMLISAAEVVATEMPYELSELVQEALANNSEIQSLEEKARALRAEAPFYGSLQDPKIGLAITNLPTDSFAFDQEPMTQKLITIDQQIPWFGTLDLAEQGAELMAVEQEAMVAAMRLSVARQVKEAWYDLAFVERSLEINDRLRELINQILQVAETRYATGSGLQQDILLAQVQLSELLDKDVSLKSSKRKIQDMIGSLLNRNNLFDDGTSRPDFPDLAGLGRENLTTAALQQNPLINARRTAVLKADIDVKLAEKAYMPDMGFRLAYGQRDDDPVSGRSRADLLTAGVTLSVPLWQNTRQDSKLAGSKRRLLSARRSLQALEKTLPHRIDGLLSEIDGAKESRDLFVDAINIQAIQLADSSLAAYSVGKVEFNTMLSTHIRLLQIELKTEQLTYLIYKKLAELEETVGQPIVRIKEK
jgi:outer membrane protein TolC